MPCDRGRLKSVLEWILVTGQDFNDKDFRDARLLAKAGVADGDASKIFAAVRDRTEGRDDSSYHLTAECFKERPAILVEVGREIMGLAPVQAG